MAQGNQHTTKNLRQKHARAILKRLKDEAVKVYLDSDGNPKPITQTQLRAGEVYLKKTMPDLRSVEHKGKVDHKIEVAITRED